ncbi:hypothetical protein GF352_04865 [archaeon]|nr:hypothetical protein [archaeon]
MLILLLVTGAISFLDGNERLSLALLLTPLLLSASIATYVNGYLCSTYPDVQEVTNYEVFFYECPSHLRGGCAFQVYNKYNHYSEFLFEPGQNTMSVPFIFGNIKGYDVYFCDTECSCSRWAVAGGCGENGCPSDKKYIERDCDPGCGLETTGCGYSCEVNSYCGDGVCNNGENCDNCARDCGECPETCSSRHHTSCHHGNLWWYDSCGNREEIRRYCDNGCSGNSCNEPPEPENECSTNCPSGWTCYESSCYKDLGSKSWTDGKSACEELKSHLVTVNDAGENKWVDDFTRGDVWIGYNDRGSEGDWEWLYDSSGYKHWHNNEPNNAGNEDCAHMWSDGTWNDAKCGKSKTVVCEKEDGADIVPDTPCSNTCTTNCPSGWSCRADSCYKETSGSWTSVKSYCESLGAHIITVNDNCENEWINPGWIGYHDRSSEGWWQWVSGSSSFTNWHSGEPNNAGNEDCTEVWGGATWNDAKCSNNRVSYCEVEDPCPASCDDGDDCTSDSCSVNGCVHETISPCDGNGDCEQGEHYCNSVDCPAPNCGECQEVTCTNNGPECSYLTNCCGNNACEEGEDCISCPGDCGCALGVDLGSVECFVSGEPCQDHDEILSTDTITTSFTLLNASHKEGTSVRVEFKANNEGLGGKTVSSSQVTHSFSLPGGRQSVMVTADDLLSSESTNALLFSITIKEEGDGEGGGAAYPFDYEQGNYKENSEPVNPDYTPSSAALLGGLGAAALAGLGGLALSKKYINQGTYVPHQTINLKSYEMNWFEKIIEGWKIKGVVLFDSIKAFIKNPGVYLKRTGKALIEDYKTWVKEKWYFLGNPVIYLSDRVGSAFIHGLKTNPIDTLAATAIVIGSILLPFSGGSSSLLIGAGLLAGGGAATIFTKESYEFATSENYVKLYNNAAEDPEKIMWVVSGALTCAQAFKIVNTLNQAVNGQTYILDSFDDLKALKRSNVFKLNDEYYGLYDNIYNNVKGPGVLVKIKKQWMLGDQVDDIRHVIIFKDHALTPKHFSAISAHEHVGEAAMAINLVKEPKLDFKYFMKGLTRKQLHELTADVVASNFVGKEAMIAARTASGYPNWWTQYPEIVNTVQNNVPWYLGKNYIGTVSTQITVGGELLTNGTK